MLLQPGGHAQAGRWAALLCVASAACTGSAPGDGAPGTLFVTSGFTDEVWVLDASTGRTIGSRSLDVRRAETDEPHGVTVSPDQRHWYATVAHGSPTLWKFDGIENRLVGRLDLPTHGASRIGIDPSGRWAWVPDYWRSGEGADGQVAVVDLVTLEVRSADDVCPAPHDAQVSPTGEVVAVTCAFSDEVVLLDTESAAEVGRTQLDGASEVSGQPRLRPMNVVWSPEGSIAYVTLMGAGQVLAIDPLGNEVARVAVGDRPAQLAVHPDGHTIVVANRGDASASVIKTQTDGSTLVEVGRVQLDGADHPHGVALNGDGSVAYLTYEGTTRSGGGVVAVDIATLTELWRTEVGVYTLGVAWSGWPPASMDE